MDFDFSLVDGLTSISPRDLDAALRRIGVPTVSSLGAVIEYEFMRRQDGYSHLPRATQLAITSFTNVVEIAVETRSTAKLTNVSTAALAFEITSIPSTVSQNPPWLAFRRRLIDGAKRAGFDPMFAKGLGGAFGELVDNAIDHSERRESAIVAYRWELGAFEMAVADAGIGVRNSLCKNPANGSLNDDQEAIEMATTMGVTRHADGSGHGTGFKTIFDALANLSGNLRFRSGTAAMMLDGSRLGTIERLSVQRDPFSGFVATICCRP